MNNRLLTDILTEIKNENNSKVSNNDSPILDLNNSAIKSLIKSSSHSFFKYTICTKPMMHYKTIMNR